MSVRTDICGKGTFGIQQAFDCIPEMFSSKSIHGVLKTHPTNQLIIDLQITPHSLLGYETYFEALSIAAYEDCHSITKNFYPILVDYLVVSQISNPESVEQCQGNKINVALVSEVKLFNDKSLLVGEEVRLGSFEAYLFDCIPSDSVIKLLASVWITLSFDLSFDTVALPHIRVFSHLV
ncbi:hypothetical protein BpHYR1_045727 [Brachionus plicatilis]|uniref:Uncharacterized protein n=1 Tax=Brachionus plicatilis TaxID=10195 RepID=A0A3M7PWI3_BRAPC|nr:hypothetical protein BpHYR1_045727 [Brachionus plicatilis]